MEQTSKGHRITVPKYTLGEELINSITHGIGAGLGIAALVLSIVKSCSPLDGYKLASSIVFGLTTTLLYLMSCLYHALKVNKAKRVFRVIDHCTIFLLIAGTYTPYTLITLRGMTGWLLFGIVWGVSILGIVLNAVSLSGWQIIFPPINPVSLLQMCWLCTLWDPTVDVSWLWASPHNHSYSQLC